MKIILISFLFFTISAFGQTKPCNLNYAKLPKIKGLKLGMSIDNFRKVFFVRVPVNQSVNDVIIRRPELEKFGGFENIVRAVFGFDNDQLIYFAFQYDKKLTKWHDAKDFTARLPEGINLPIDSWKYDAPLEATLDCENFSVGLDSFNNEIYFYKKGGSRIIVYDK